MKRKRFVVRLAVLAVVLCLVTMSLTAGTLAKYTSEAAGNATATVAKWKVKLTQDGTEVNGPNSITLDLHDADQEAANLVAANKVAPGTKGSFALALDAGDTEVAFHYTIELDFSGLTAGGKTLPIKLYDSETERDKENGTELTLDGSKKLTVEGDVLTDGTKTASQNVYWKWATDTDAADTALGEASAAVEGGGGLVFNIPVTLNAEQLLTAPASGA